MKILQLGVDVAEGEIRMKKRTPYVMADPLAQSLANRNKGAVQRFEMFEPYYKPYMGQGLDKKSIAIWRTGGFGDLLFITPIVEYLKRRYPTCRVSVATSERFKDVWKNNPNISKLTSSYTLPISLDFVTRHDYAGIFEGTIENFKTEDQYCAIDAFAFNLGIFDMPLELKRPRYYLTSSEVNIAKNKVRSKTGLDIYKDKYVCFQWKSSSKLRDYPYEKLIAAMHSIQKETGYKIVILTHPNYRGVIEHEMAMAKEHMGFESPLEYINLAGITSYRESAAVLALGSGVVGIDSSLAHMAAALGVPSVTIYGPFKAEWRTIYNRNNISLQHQDACPNAPCAYHTPPNHQDGLPYDQCTMDGKLPQYSRDTFCRVMCAVTVEEITEAYMKLMDLQAKGELPIEREFKCNL